MPRLMREAFPGGALEEFTISPGDPLALEVEIETAAEAIRRTFAVRPVPPLESGHVSFAACEDALFLELDFLMLEEGRAELSLRVSGRFGVDLCANLDAVRFLDAFCRQERVALRSERLLPGGEQEGRFHLGTEQDHREIESRRLLYEALSLIEQRTGADFALPERLCESDLAAIAAAAKVLETGAGTATLEAAEGIVEASEIPWLSERLHEERVTRRPVVYEILGQRVELGLAEYELPPLRVIDVKPLGYEAGRARACPHRSRWQQRDDLPAARPPGESRRVVGAQPGMRARTGLKGPRWC